MQSNKKNIKTTCTENEKPVVPLPAAEVADMAGISESLVKKIRSGHRNKNSENGQKVAFIDEGWATGTNAVRNLLMEEIKRVSPL